MAEVTALPEAEAVDAHAIAGAIDGCRRFCASVGFEADPEVIAGLVADYVWPAARKALGDAGFDIRRRRLRHPPAPAPGAGGMSRRSDGNRELQDQFVQECGELQKVLAEALAEMDKIEHYSRRRLPPGSGGVYLEQAAWFPEYAGEPRG